jgi:hypothetical protein
MFVRKIRTFNVDEIDYSLESLVGNGFVGETDCAKLRMVVQQLIGRLN